MNSFAESYTQKCSPNVCVNLEKTHICIFANQNNYRSDSVKGELRACILSNKDSNWYLSESNYITRSISVPSHQEVGGPGKFTNCSTFLVLKTDICCFLKNDILFSVSIFTALLRLYIGMANMIKDEKALLVQLVTVQQHYVLLQAKHLFQASRKKTSSLKHISMKW